MNYVLAQLVDLLPSAVWYALAFVGLAAPAAGLLLAAGIQRFRPWTCYLVAGFYLIAAPGAYEVIAEGTETPAWIIFFFTSLLTGVILGGLLLLPARKRYRSS